MITSNNPDPRHYKAGIFYFNKEDPRLMVPKRFGIGRTLNFARPASWGILAIFAAAFFGIYYIRHH